MKKSIVSLITSLFCKPIDNLFSLEKYASGQLLMVGDKVCFSELKLFKRTGEIIALNQHRYIDNFTTYSVDVEVKGKIYRKCPRALRVLSRRESYIDHWKKTFSGDGYFERVLEEKLLEHKERLNAEFVADMSTLYSPEDSFKNGLYALIANTNDDLAMSFFELSLSSSTNILKNEENCRKSDQWARYAGRTLRVRAYAQELTGQKMDRNLLLRAIEHIKSRSQNLSSRDWWAEAQDEYLSAVRMAIIADELDLARELLKSSRSFKKHKDQRALLKKLTRKSIKPNNDPDLMKSCFMYVDFIRSPFCSDCNYFSSSWGAIEWGIIIEKCFSSTANDNVDWNTLIKKFTGRQRKINPS